MRQHKVLRLRAKLLNMLTFGGAGCAHTDVRRSHSLMPMIAKKKAKAKKPMSKAAAKPKAAKKTKKK